MGHYTTFYFRAKLIFDLPEPVRKVLRQQFETYEQHKERAGQLAQNWTEWVGAKQFDHPFFSLPRAGMIPWGSSMGETFPPATYKEYLDGSSILEFTCEFKNYDDEIEQFLDWIRPYVRLRYGKRSRGRNKVWVGWLRPKSADDRSNIFIKPVSDPNYHEGNLFDRAVDIVWRS